MITALHHAQITIRPGSEDRARDFYCRLLGLPEIPKPPSLQSRGGFWLQLANCQLHVGTEDSADRLSTKAHLAYQVTDLEHYRRLIQSAGLLPIDSVAIPGFARFETRDPFGNRLEFIQAL